MQTSSLQRGEVEEIKTRPQPRRMTRTLINFWVDAGLFVGLAVLLWVSAMLRVVFPTPSAAAGWKLWGLSFDDWYNVQFGALCFLVVLVVEHLVLHWNWVCTVFAGQVLRSKSRPDEGVQAVYGVGTFIAFLIVMLAAMMAALFGVTAPPLM
jgi:hypothetical protein